VCEKGQRKGLKKCQKVVVVKIEKGWAYTKRRLRAEREKVLRMEETIRSFVEEGKTSRE